MTTERAARTARIVLKRPLTGRDPSETHRPSTPLELLFDLCFVVAVAQAATELHHGFESDHIRSSVAGYMMVFFAIWWAWLNFTWFASAYDTDDVLYRMLTFVQIVGVLILASGISDAVDGHFGVITTGYVVMRVSLTLQWLRAAAADVERRRNALRYALSLTVIQVGWVVALSLPRDWRYFTFLVLVAAELAGPYWSEHTGQMTQWHPKHIAERYGLFTIIVLGECILASFLAIDAARHADGTTAELAIVAAAGLVTMFGLWWSYFRVSAESMLESRSLLAFVWGYGHYFLFASIAALGAGIAAVAAASGDSHGDDASHGLSATETAHAGLSTMGLALVVAVPVSVALLLLALMRPLLEGRTRRLDLVAYASAPLVVGVGLLGDVIGLRACLVLIALIVVARAVFDEMIVGSARAR